MKKNQGRHYVAQLLNVALLIAIFMPMTSAARNDDVEVSLQPIEITPEAVNILIEKNLPFVLINADKPTAVKADDLPSADKIYYTLGVSKNSARKAARSDRYLTKSASRVLVGTPLEWNHLHLPFPENITPSSHVLVSPKSLASAVKDGEDLLIIDLRDGLNHQKENKSLLLQGAVNLLPHQVKDELKSISKLRWTILMDDGNQTAESVAAELTSAGYLLVGVLSGGYPAWVAEVNK